MSAPRTLAEELGSEDAAVDALRDAFNAEEITPTLAVQAGPRCPWPRMVPPPPVGPPIEPPVTRVDNATWARWEADRQQHVDARPPGQLDARQRLARALDAEYIDLDTASARCPRCHGPLAIRWRGELTDLDCVDGCPPADVEAAVAGVVA